MSRYWIWLGNGYNKESEAVSVTSLMALTDGAGPLTTEAFVNTIQAIRGRVDNEPVRWVVEMRPEAYQRLLELRRQMTHYRGSSVRHRRPFGRRQRVRYLDRWEFTDE